MNTQEHEQRHGYGADTFGAPGGAPAVIDLPAEYGEDGVVLMPRDPHWAFAYWEITPGREEALRRTYGDRFQGAEVQLRVYEFQPAHPDAVTSTIPIPVRERVGSWYLHLGAPGHQFQVEIGYLLKDGEFVGVARSNRVELPPVDISDEMDADWVIVEEDFRTLFQSVRKELVGTGSLEAYLVREDWMKALRARLEGEAASGWVGSPGVRP